MTVVRHAESRRTRTPSGVATTLASPTQGGADRPLWRVDMNPGASGPLHTFDAQQVWTALDGAATLELGDRTLAVAPGDTVVMPADVTRRVHADPEHGFSAIVVGTPGAAASVPGSPDTTVPAWTV